MSAVSQVNPVAMHSRCQRPAVSTKRDDWLKPAADIPRAVSIDTVVDAL